MNVWEYREIILIASIPALILVFYALLRLQRWKTSEEIHMSRFDMMWHKAKYFIGGTMLGSVTTYIIHQVGW